MAASAIVIRYGCEVRASLVSVGVALEEYPQPSEQDDLQVERQRPVLDVVGVVQGAVADRRRAAKVVDLGPTSQTRPDLLPLEVSRHVGAVLLVEERRLRAGTDQAHVALDYVDQLRQLIEAGFA